MSKQILRTACIAAFTAMFVVNATESYGQTAAIATGNWEDASTWSNGVPDAIGNAAQSAVSINNDYTVTLSQQFQSANFIDVGSIDGQTGNLDITSGDITTTSSGSGATARTTVSIAREPGSTGNMTMSGGDVIILNEGIEGFSNDFIVGDNGVGSLTMTGGSISSGDEVAIGLGATGVGTVDISGGELTAEGLNLLVGFGGNGTLNVSGTAAVSSATSDVYVGFFEGASGTVNQSGGTIEAGYLFSNSFASGDGVGSTATINQTGGTFTARNAYVLGQGAGTTTFNHSGGLVDVVGDGAFVVGDGGGNTSTYNMSGTATVNVVNDVFVGTFEGSTGNVNQTGGTITAGRNYRIGADGVGNWNISGGALNGGNIFLGDYDSSFGTLDISGGAVTLTGNLNVGGALASNAPAPEDRGEPVPDPFDAQGQALDANGTFIVTGSGGAIDVAGNLLANPDDKSAFRGGRGTANPDDANGSVLRFVTDSSGVSTIGIGLIADLDGAVIDIDDTAGFFSSNPEGSLTLIDADGGFGNVFTITAAEAAGNGIGFTQADGDAGLFNLAIEPNGSGGQRLVATAGMGGLAGDLNGDNQVDGADFLAFQQGFGTTTDASDLAAFQANYGAGVSATAATQRVPEPTSGVLLLIAAVGLATARTASRSGRRA